ncbi:MAG: GAF domain-containing protein [Actinomycetota bacterium]
MDKNFFAQCEREQLHLSGAVQAHGTLLMVDSHGRISHAASNVADFLGAPPAHWVGQPLPAELAPLVADLASGPGSRKNWVGAVDRGAGLLDVVVSRGEARKVAIELTPHQADSTGGIAPDRIRPSPPLRSDEALAAAREALTERIAGLTGFQRVMYYAFREDGDGEVIAETRRDEAYGSYLGLRFPASDIPEIARRLYLKNPWRLIPDAQAEPVALKGRDAHTPDLTWSDLRSVSLVHRVYLANMGVRASLSFPVVIDGALAALIAAHHREVRQVPLAVLEHAEALVRAHALAVSAYQSAQYSRLVSRLSRRFEDIQALIRPHGRLISSWPQFASWLMGEFLADGATLCIDETSLGAGHSFEPAALSASDAWFRKKHGDLVWASDNLSHQVPDYPQSEIAGALALQVVSGDGSSLRLYLTRTEYIHKVAWGGNPEKPVEIHNGILNIAPRRSFEKWVEKRRGYSRSWDNQACLLALSLAELLHREFHS